LQVDLFFYRDPEEAKEQEGEAAVPPEFAAITDYQGADQWGGDQWTSDVAVPPVAPTGADWGAAPGIYCYLLFLEFPRLWYQTSLSMHVVFR